jgi:hypothetical protein
VRTSSCRSARSREASSPKLRDEHPRRWAPSWAMSMDRPVPGALAAPDVDNAVVEVTSRGAAASASDSRSPAPASRARLRMPDSPWVKQAPIKRVQLAGCQRLLRVALAGVGWIVVVVAPREPVALGHWRYPPARSADRPRPGPRPRRHPCVSRPTAGTRACRGCRTYPADGFATSRQRIGPLTHASPGLGCDQHAAYRALGASSRQRRRARTGRGPDRHRKSERFSGTVTRPLRSGWRRETG